MPFKKGQSGNPKGRPRKDAAVDAHFDGWKSALMGFGTARDKRTDYDISADEITHEHATQLWRGDDLGGRVIEKVPDEMLREGYQITLKSDGDEEEIQELQEDIEEKFEELEIEDRLSEVLKYERAYGGGALLLGALDGSRNMALPFNPERVRPDGFKFLTSVEPRELRPLLWYNDPLDPKYGRPAVWEFTPTNPGVGKSGSMPPTVSAAVHESRLIIFGGRRVTKRHVTLHAGWGDSLFTRLFTVLRQFSLSWDGASALTADFAQAVLKLEGLPQIIGTNKDQLFRARMESLEEMRSVLRLIVIGENDDYLRTQTPVTGLPELLQLFMTRFAAAADMPLTVLMGISPAGLNATGESDIRLFYDRIASMQRKKLKRPIRYLAELCLRSAGEWNDDTKIAVKFNPLWQPTDDEKAASQKTLAEADSIRIADGVLTPDEVRVARYSNETISFDMTVDTSEEAMREIQAERDEQLAQEKAMQEAELAAMQQGAKDKGKPPE